jgi:hypothetical protein
MVSARLPRTASRTAAAAWLSTGAGSSTASCPWVTVPAADSIFAIALRAASGSTMPGTSTRARSATRTPVASGEVSRSGWSIPAENVTSMVSPENSKSIRSPGP